MTLHRAPAVLIVIAVLAACSGDDTTDDSTEPPSSASVATTAPVTSTTPPTTTTVPPTTPSTTVPPDTTSPPAPTTGASTTAPSLVSEEDLAVILEELYLRSDQLYAEPDLARIEEIAFPGSNYAQHLEAQLGDAISRGWRTVDRPATDVIAVENVTIDGATVAESRFAMFDATVAIDPATTDFGRIIDAEGTTVMELTVSDPTAPRKGHVVLARYTTEEPWRLSQLNAAG